ncbi:TetR/AcrR family transcriptional regulator [Cryobacterium arcticum]|uniref:TetR family transcription regulator n=1 Tax=Cryobacterium arcticum TaxID=670052 RepID=A0A1B1BLS5_9MICO|nr:TetR/AcrR family transcriptional regulator [Cryobacterium arcticum]ANP73476.1 TetR family transcription regulator [Cryobacterium arcticum]
MTELAAASVSDDQRTRIVEVAARLLRERGAGGLTTRGVADAADVQPPAIYRLFGDKDGLIEAVAEHVLAEHVAAKSTVGDSGDPVAALRSGWQLQIDFGLANPDLGALLTAPGRARRSPAIEAGIEVLRARVRALAEAGLLRVSQRRAVDLIHAAGAGAVLALQEAAPEERDPGLSEALLDAVLQQILEPDADGIQGDISSTAIAVTFAAHIPTLLALTPAERSLLTEWVGRSIDAAEH